MARRDRRRDKALARKGASASRLRASKSTILRVSHKAPDRRALLLGSALVSIGLLGTVAAPTEAPAASTCTVGGMPQILPLPPGAIALFGPEAAPIVCDNDDPREGDAGSDFAAINLETAVDGNTIVLDSDGLLQSTNPGAGSAFGIRTYTNGTGSFITIENRGDIDPVTGGDLLAAGIYAVTEGGNSRIELHNSGDFDVAIEGDNARAVGIYAVTEGGNSPLEIRNSGDLRVATVGPGVFVPGIPPRVFGIYAVTRDGNSHVTIENSGDLHLKATGENVQARGIYVRTYDGDNPVSISNSGGILVETNGQFTRAAGIFAYTPGGNSPTEIHNSGDLQVKTRGETAVAYGISGSTRSDSALTIENSGDIRLETSGNFAFASGIAGFASPGDSPVTIENSGDFALKTRGDSAIVYGVVARSSARVEIVNSGDFTLETRGNSALAYGINASTFSGGNALTIHNSGDFTLKTWGDSSSAFGIDVDASSRAEVVNSGDFWVKTHGNDADAYGIKAEADEDNSPLKIHNSGDFWVETRGDGADAYGINADTTQGNSPLTIHNSGDFWVKTRADNADAAGIEARVRGGSPLTIHNSGDFRLGTRGDNASAAGIDALLDGNNSLSITNSGDFWIETRGYNAAAYGIEALTRDGNSPLAIHNSGDFWVETSGDNAYTSGIYAETRGENSDVTVHNSGDIHAEAKGASVVKGIDAYTFGVNSPIEIHNSGSVFAKGGTRNVGISAYSYYANPTTIWNTGNIGAESHLAIDVKGAGTAHIDNAGTITGFVDLTSQDDVFNNQAGGVFEAKKTSLFGAGDDLFYNFSGGTVQAATEFKKSEKTFFEGLETFKNAGTISMVDGKEGDSFTISNTPGGTDLKYKAMPGATLAVDAFLGGAGSRSDIFTVEGDVSGVTQVDVRNTNTGPGVFNPTGIPVVFVDGATPSAGNFRLQDGPIDTGFFDYDLFFVPTNSGFWELRSFAGGGAHLLPQLLTAAQDIWHQSSSTWFDRTADLRVLMQDVPAPADLGGKSLAAPVQEQLTPAVWLKGGGSWLDRDANASTRAYGRNYNFNLDRELETIDVQVGIDFGTRDVFGTGDALVFGVLGGFLHGDLDYDQLARRFQYDGGQVGVYATYLSGGLFVDTLLNAHIYELDANNVAFPGSIDGNTVGLRTDAGYRFGSFSGGVFLEPLGTIEVMWADLDGFAVGGNRVSFDDEANVRGRLGLRAGTTTEVWEGTLMEPFIIGSVWGNLSDDNAATLVSTGRTFRFQDDPEDVWGEVSAGVNFFNFTQTTSVFGKVDVQFGDDLTGVGGKGGMRVVW